MPYLLLLALFLAFGMESSRPLSPLAAGALWYSVRATLTLVVLVAVLSRGLGWWGLFQKRKLEQGRPASLRAYSILALGLDLFCLLAFAAVIHRYEWPRAVRGLLGGRPHHLVTDAFTLLPFVLMQVSYWWGLCPVRRPFHGFGLESRGPRAADRAVFVWRRARQSFGMVLPVLILYTLLTDLAAWIWPGLLTGRWGLPIEALTMAALVLCLSPFFIRLAWPTSSLPQGALRTRLENQARRLGFRCADILVWDTEYRVVNACVTGSLPGLRYVLLTDGMIQNLSEDEIAAVFGHEIGHIAHRHLLFFGFFFLGSFGVLALLSDWLDPSLAWMAQALGNVLHSSLPLAIGGEGVLILSALYFLVVFGFLSRRFERQADVYGCRSVSCGQRECPPHHEVEGPSNGLTGPCPMGIRIFTNALIGVAAHNGIERRKRSWRHGSIERRIQFLEGLEGRPEAVAHFERGVSRLRAVVSIGLITALVWAFSGGTLDALFSMR